MRSVRTPRETFLALIEGVGAQRWEDLPDLYSVDAHVHHPFATNASAALVGREQLREHFLKIKQMGIKMKPHDVLVHETQDPEVVIGEFTYYGQDQQGASFQLPAIFVMRVRNGEIVESRDYGGPRRPLE